MTSKVEICQIFIKSLNNKTAFRQAQRPAKPRSLSLSKGRLRIIIPLWKTPSSTLQHMPSQAMCACCRLPHPATTNTRTSRNAVGSSKTWLRNLQKQEKTSEVTRLFHYHSLCNTNSFFRFSLCHQWCQNRYFPKCYLGWNSSGCWRSTCSLLLLPFP